MEQFQFWQDSFVWFLPLVICFVIWELVWKLLALWRAARNNNKVWFVAIALINSAGILPILYLLFHKDRHNR